MSVINSENILIVAWKFSLSACVWPVSTLPSVVCNAITSLTSFVLGHFVLKNSMVKPFQGGRYYSLAFEQFLSWHGSLNTFRGEIGLGKQAIRKSNCLLKSFNPPPNLSIKWNPKY